MSMQTFLAFTFIGEEELAGPCHGGRAVRSVRDPSLRCRGRHGRRAAVASRLLPMRSLQSRAQAGVTVHIFIITKK